MNNISLERTFSLCVSEHDVYDFAHYETVDYRTRMYKWLGDEYAHACPDFYISDKFYHRIYSYMADQDRDQLYVVNILPRY